MGYEADLGSRKKLSYCRSQLTYNEYQGTMKNKEQKQQLTYNNEWGSMEEGYNNQLVRIKTLRWVWNNQCGSSFLLWVQPSFVDLLYLGQSSIVQKQTIEFLKPFYV